MRAQILSLLFYIDTRTDGVVCVMRVRLNELWTWLNSGSKELRLNFRYLQMMLNEYNIRKAEGVC